MNMLIICCRTATLLLSWLYLLIFPWSTRSQSVNDNFQDILDDKLRSATRLLSDYIRIPSETGKENNAAYFLMDYCREKQFNIKILNDEKGCVNFAASLYPLEEGKPNIIFLNHLDVVACGDADKWTFPPYSGTISCNKVWGRGAFDNKGLAITQLTAIEQFIHITMSIIAL